MTDNEPIDDELTPEGGLGEGGIHGLLGYQLAQASVLTTAVFVSVVGKPLRLRPVEFTVLQLVHENAPVTATKLAKALGITVPAITSWLDRLEQRGLLKRERNETDRRTQNVVSTPKGADLVVTATDRLLQGDRELLKCLSTGERHMLLELLHKVARSRKR